jgi:hypothetical protein
MDNRNDKNLDFGERGGDLQLRAGSSNHCDAILRQVPKKEKVRKNNSKILQKNVSR